MIPPVFIRIIVLDKFKENILIATFVLVSHVFVPLVSKNGEWAIFTSWSMFAFGPPKKHIDYKIKPNGGYLILSNDYNYPRDFKAAVLIYSMFNERIESNTRIIKFLQENKKIFKMERIRFDKSLGSLMFDEK